MHRPGWTAAKLAGLVERLLYSPDCQPMEELRNDWRDHVTHNHDRLRIGELEGDREHYFAESAQDPAGVLRTIASPIAKRRENHKT